MSWGWNPHDEISALIKKKDTGGGGLLPPCEDTAGSGHLQTRKWVPHHTRSAGALLLDI